MARYGMITPLFLFTALAVAKTGAQDFQISAEWPKSIPVFQVKVDNVGEHRYTNYKSNICTPLFETILQLAY